MPKCDVIVARVLRCSVRHLAGVSLFCLLAATASAGGVEASRGKIGPRLRYLRHAVAHGRIDPPGPVAVSLLLSEKARGGSFDTQLLAPSVALRRGHDGQVLRTD